MVMALCFFLSFIILEFELSVHSLWPFFHPSIHNIDVQMNILIYFIQNPVFAGLYTINPMSLNIANDLVQKNSVHYFTVQ